MVAALPATASDDPDRNARIEAAREALEELLRERLPALQQTLRMREVGRFAESLQEIGQDAALSVIKQYGERLAQAVQQFDVTTAESLLQQFPAHVASALASNEPPSSE